MILRGFIRASCIRCPCGCIALFGELAETRFADARQLHYLIGLVRVLHEHRLAQQRAGEHTCVFIVKRGWDDDLDALLCSVGHGVHGLSRYKVANCAVRYCELIDGMVNLASVRQCAFAAESSAFFDLIDEHAYAISAQVKLLTIC